MVITGAGKGLGRAYALYLAKLGATVVVNNRRHSEQSSSSADQVVSEITAAGGTAVAEYSSVEDPAAGENLLRLALDTFGRLDAVVANAGISEGCSFHKQSLEQFRQVIDINLMGTVNILHPAYRHMYEQRHGCIVVSSSVAGLYGEHGLPAYSASKAALLGLMYTLSLEGARHGVRTNALAPFAATQMTEKDLPEALKDRMSADQVAPVLAWLISDDCNLNGEIIVSGGGKISRARMMETAAARLALHPGSEGASIQEVWDKLVAEPPDSSYPSSLAQFGAFISDREPSA